MRGKALFATSALVLVCAAVAQAGFIVEPDIDKADNGVLVWSPNFSFGNGQTTASQSVAGVALGLTGGDSIFGGNSTTKDQYIYSYTPGLNADNATFTAGADLGNGNFATGLVGGASGPYRVYATWPSTKNISAETIATNYQVTSDGALVETNLLQDEDVNGDLVGDKWVLLGTVQLTAGHTYQVIQTAPDSAYVSMRASGVMWEVVPEPGSISLLALGALGLLCRRR